MNYEWKRNTFTEVKKHLDKGEWHMKNAKRFSDKEIKEFIALNKKTLDYLDKITTKPKETKKEGK